MGVEILRVPLGADVSDFVAGLLRDAARAAPPFEPVPVVYLAANERRARAVSRLAGELYPEGTPERVARELLKLTAPGIRLRGEVERDFDFFGALAAALDELGERRRPGRALVNELLTAWKRLAQAIHPDNRDELDWLTPLGRRGELFGGVVRRYRSRLAEVGCQDPEDAPWLAAATLNARPGLLIADDLDRLTPAREALLMALAQNAERSLFILRGDRELLPFLAGAHDVSQQMMFDAGGRVLPEREWPTRPLAGAAEAWLRDERVDAPVTLLRPPTRAAEVREAARLIKRAYGEGVPLSEICVAMPSTGGYAELIEEIFGASGIPFDAPFETPLVEAPPVAALLDLVRAARNGLERNELLDALASPFMPFGAPPTLHRDLDRVTLEGWVVGGPDARKDWLDRLDAKGHEKWPGIRDDLERVLTQLAPFTRARLAAGTFFEALETLIDQSGVAEVAAADRRAGDRGAPLREQSLHAFRGLVRDMRAEFLRGGNPQMPVNEIFRALFEQAQARGVRPPETRGVRVLGLRELRGARVRRLYVLGLTDRDLPLPEEQTMFLPPSREEVLATSIGAPLARHLCAPLDVTAQADYLFAHMLLAAGEELTLMLPGSENDTPFVPATPFARLLRGLGQSDIEKLDPCAGAETPTSPGDLAGAAASALSRAEREGLARPATLALSASLESGLRGRCVELARTDLVAPPGEFEGMVGALGQGADSRFSPSQIDSYAACPMRYWGRYILRVKAPEEPTLDTRPSAVGTLLHDVLERWVLLLRRHAGEPDVLEDATQRKPILLSEAGGREAGLRLMAEAFEQACAASPGEGPFWEGVKKLVAAGLPGQADEGLGQGMLVRFVDHELGRNAQGWGIRFVEFDFGKGNRPRPERPDTVPAEVEFETPAGVVRLMGSVDRVDEGPEGLEIIDYKTGNTRTSAEVRDGKSFQLPTYLAAISRLAGTPPVGMKYLKVPPDGEIKPVDVTLSSGKPAYDVNELVFTRLPERLGRILQGIREGVFMHTPWAPLREACKYCDYITACARRADVIGERQSRMAEAETPEVEHAYLPEKP
jgi:RecB family exonuclease